MKDKKKDEIKRTPHKELCKKCGHNKAWGNRGNVIPTYESKCSKCGNINY